MASRLPSPGIFDFADRNGILFEWNEEVDKFPKGIIKVEDIILYPSLAAEHPGVVHGPDQPLPLIEEELVPQGRAKDAVAHNSNLQPFEVAGVAAAPIVHANVDKLDDYKSDDNNGIIAKGDIPQLPPHAPLVVNNTDNDDTAGSDNDDNDNNNDDSSDKGDDNKPTATSEAEDNESGSNQGVHRSRCRDKGVMQKCANYSLLMAARREKRGGHVGLSSAIGAFSFQQTI